MKTIPFRLITCVILCAMMGAVLWGQMSEVVRAGLPIKDVMPPAAPLLHADGELIVKLQPGHELIRSPGVRPQSTNSELVALLLNERVVASEPLYPIRPSAPSKMGATANNLAMLGMERVYRWRLAPGADVETTAARLRGSPLVEYAEPNYLLRAAGDLPTSEDGLAVQSAASSVLTTTVTPDDPLLSQQWGLTQIGAEAAWGIEQGNTGMIIAILDTGLDLDHPDFTGRLWENPGEVVGDGIDNDNNGLVDDINGWNFADNNDLLQDDSGHGTHVTGIAAANGNNGIGIAGTDWNTRIMPLRVLNAGGAGSHADAAAALVYAADKGAQVINMSFGAYADSQTLRDAIAYAAETALLVGAAGNDGRTERFYPAAYDQVLAVAGTRPSDVKASFSNYGPWIEISAPGETIWSTVFDDSYVGWSGTSMAAPFVAGAASLTWAHYPALSVGSLRQHLLNTTIDIGLANPGYVGLLGAGRLDLSVALNTPPLPRLGLQGVLVNGDAAGRPEPGVTTDITIAVANTWADATDVSGVLTTLNPNVTTLSNTTTFSDIPGATSRASVTPFQITLDALTPFNSPIAFIVQVSASGGYSVALPFTLTTSTSLQNVAALTIAQDTTWDAGRQFVIGGRVRVLEGVTLTLQPGVLLQFQPTGALVISGTLIADGTAEAPITLQGTGAGLWGGLTFTRASRPASLDASDSYLNGSIVRHAQVMSATTGIVSQNAAPLITDSDFTGNGVGISAVGGSPLIRGNTFVGNSTGLSMSGGSTARAENNLFQGNTNGLSGAGVAAIVRRNRFVGNTTGLSMSTSGAAIVEGNLIEENATGASLSPGWPTGARTEPDVAYIASRDEYLAVWQDGRDVTRQGIYGQRVSNDGTLVGAEIPIAVSGDYRMPRLACDPVGDACLVLFRSHLPVGGVYPLLGQLILSDGALSGTLFTIAAYTGTENSIAVEANTNQGGYLVVWNDLVGGDYDVYAQRITAVGEITGSQIMVISDTLNQMDVALAYNAKTDEFLAVWAEQGTYSGWDLYGRRLRADGSFPGIPFAVAAASPSNQRHPVVDAETSQGWYTIVWEDDRNGSTPFSFYGRRLTGTGILYGGDSAIETAMIYPSTFPSPLSDIVYCPKSGEMLVVWLGPTMEPMARRVSSGGGLVTQGDLIWIEALPYDHLSPRVAVSPEDGVYLTTWSFRDPEGGRLLIYGQRLSSEGVQLDNPGTTRNESASDISFPIVLGASFRHNTVSGNQTGLTVNAVDGDLLAAQGNNLVRNTTLNVVNAGSGSLGLIRNYWGYTDTAQISPTINGAAILSPTLESPDATAPAILWRLLLSREKAPAPVEAVEGVSYGPVGAELLTLSFDFPKPMDTSRPPDVTLGNGDTASYTPTHQVRFGEWVSPTRWTGQFQVDWYTGDGAKRVSVNGARGAEDGFPAPADRRFTFDVSILGASSERNITVINGWGWVGLTWPALNFSTIAGYHVYRSTGGAPFERVNASIVSTNRYTDTTVVNQTPYAYLVKVVNTDLQERDYTNQATAFPGDTSGPTAPQVWDDGQYSSSTSGLHARWQSTDLESGIAEYQYRIGTTPGGAQILNWTSVGSATEVTRTGLSLTNGTTYYFAVKARNGASLWSNVGQSDGVKIFLGDFDGDCEVTVTDIMRVAGRWNSHVGEPGYDPWYDFDRDGDIDVVDIMRVAAVWGTRCPTSTSGAPGTKSVTVRADGAGPGIAFQPVRLTAAPGEIVTATIAISGGHNLGGFELRVKTDPAFLDITGVALGSFLGSTGNTAAPLGGMSTLNAGVLTFGGFSFGSHPGPEGDGALAVITARVLRRGITSLELQSVQLVDMNAQAQAPGSVQNGLVDSTIKVWLPVVLRGQ